jgi:hypothetical protein
MSSFLGVFTKLRTANISFFMSVRLSVLSPSARNNSAPIIRIFMKVDICAFLGTLPRIFKFHENLKIIMDTFDHISPIYSQTEKFFGQVL